MIKTSCSFFKLAPSSDLHVSVKVNAVLSVILSKKLSVLIKYSFICIPYLQLISCIQLHLFQTLSFLLMPSQFRSLLPLVISSTVKTLVQVTSVFLTFCYFSESPGFYLCPAPVWQSIFNISVIVISLKHNYLFKIFIYLNHKIMSFFQTF